MKWVRENRIDVLLVLAIFALSFGIRIIPADVFPDIYGFDSFYAARQAKYMIQGGSFPYEDNRTWYPVGRTQRASELGWWGLNVITYQAVAAANGVQGFDYALFGAVTSWLTAIFGSMAPAFMYLFVSKAYNRIAGLASGFILLGSGNNLFYSIFGHAENDALGLTLFLASFWLFAETIKNRSWKLGALTALSWAWMGMTWPVYRVGMLLIGGMVLTYFLARYVLKEMEIIRENSDRVAHNRWILNAAFMSMLSGPIQFIFNHRMDNFATAVFAIGAPLLVAAYIEFGGKTFGSLKDIKKDALRISCALAAAMMVGIVLFYGLNALNYPLATVGIRIIPGPSVAEPDYAVRMIQTIAEQNPVPGGEFMGRLSYLQRNYGYAIWMAFFASIFMIMKIMVMPFLRKSFDHEWDIFAAGFVLVSLYTLTERSITLFFLSSAVAFGAGIFIGELWKAIKGTYHKALKKAVPKAGKFSAFFKVLFIASLLTMLFSYTTLVIPQAKSMGYDVPREWFETFEFINSSEDIEQDSVITAWWDYGHWMNYYNGDKIIVSMDNIQSRKDIIYTVASAFTHTTPCTADRGTQQIYCESSPEQLERAEKESLSLLKPLGTTHILIDKEIIGGSSGGKLGALQHIANNYMGCMQEIGCRRQSDGKVECQIGTDNRGQPIGFTFSPQDWDSLTKNPWPGQNVIDAGIPARLFAVETSSGRLSIFLSALQCGGNAQLDSNAPVIYAFLQRLYFSDPSLKHVRKIFDNGWNVIYEVDWSEIPDPEEYTNWTKANDVLVFRK